MNRDPRRGATGPKAGFTLLEVLTAVAILMIIIVTLSGLFQQSSKAWQSGVQRAEIGMEGRAAVTFMARELEQAVADGEYLDDGTASVGGSTIRFYTLHGAGENNRAVSRVEYKLMGSQLIRTVERVSATGGYPPVFLQPADTHSLVDRVTMLEFKTPDGQGFTTNVPEWVDVRMQLSKTSKFRGFAVWSRGPDGTDNNGEGDDAPSW